MTTSQQMHPPQECPRWHRCSVNHCPLDPHQKKRLPDPEDKEPVCTMAKTRRFQIGSKYPELLPMLGLTPREFAAKQRCAGLSADQRQAMADRGRRALATLRSGSNDKTTKIAQGVPV